MPSTPDLAAAPDTRVRVPGGRRRSTQGLRNLELALLVFAVAIFFAAILLVQLGASGGFDFNVITMPAIIAALTFGVHIVLRFIAPQADPFILPIAMTLNGIGISMLYRLDLAHVAAGEESGFASAQMIYTAVGVVMAIIVLFLLKNHRVLLRFMYISMALAILLLLLPLVPGLGDHDAAARVWISIGPFNFQPGEIAKIALAVFFAGYLVTARETLSVVGTKFLGIQFPRLRDLAPIMVVWAVCMGVLVFQRDLGTSMLYFGLFLVMMFVATGRISWIVIGLVLVAIGGVLAYNFMGYVNFRVHAWLDPFDPEMIDASGGSYQLLQSLYGLANGGLIGQGLGQGRPLITPVAESDFIISALGEELGLAGLFVIFSLYLILVARGFRIGHQGIDDFGRLLAMGLSFTIAWQVFIVVGGVTRVIPLTGLTTPFLAAGGSSLLANWIIVAILLRLSDTVRQTPVEDRE